MKFLFLISLLLPCSLRAENASWVSVHVDHIDSRYSAGEKAAFHILVNNRPTNPNYSVYVTVQKVGEGVPSNVLLHSGVGTHITGSLAAGTSSFEIVTHFSGPATSTQPAFDQIVQDDLFQLQVNQ